MNTKETVEAWAEITIKNWLENIKKENIGDTGKLAKSFVEHVVSGSGGDVGLVEFTFAYYGKMVDMGVGKGTTLALRGDKTAIKLQGRHAKKWFSKELWHQVQRLRELLAEKYGHEMKTSILELNYHPAIELS